MIKETSRKTVIAGFMLALGILLPYFTSHGLIFVPGKILLPMHIPVLLCGFYCGPLFGGLCGLVLPFLNSILTGMPVMYPNAVIMCFELMTYGCISGIIYRITGCSNRMLHVYTSLIAALIAGRAVYGIVAGLLLFANPALKNLSVAAAVIDGIPGIVIQLVLIPQIVRLIPISNTELLRKRATAIINSGKATCVVIRGGKIIYAKSHKGIGHLIELYDKGYLENAYVADTVVGKAAAMIMTLGKIRGCHGQNTSESAKKWFEEKEIPFTYTNISPHIINRTGDGMCPMELTVQNTDNAEEGLSLLRAKLKELKEKQK